MERRTGIKKHIEGLELPVELWVGDVIECRVYITDRCGCCLRITGTVVYEVDYAMYSVHGTYRDEGKEYRGFFPLHKIVNENVKFLKSVPREFDSQRDIIFHIVEEMRKYQHTPNDGEMEDAMDAMDAMINRICDMGIIPEKEIREAFAGD